MRLHANVLPTNCLQWSLAVQLNLFIAMSSRVRCFISTLIPARHLCRAEDTDYRVVQLHGGGTERVPQAGPNTKRKGPSKYLEGRSILGMWNGSDNPPQPRCSSLRSPILRADCCCVL
jgi:hypothetical protein